mmetsp:Transcript_18236/g.30254  ORF Transcript_18236/g.30254 Transcript_18236/m.30254 type:complete len:559 (+) Transcript_18236:54-1730(+)
MMKIVKVLSFLLTLIPLVRSQCPNVNETIIWNGPCTYEAIFNETGCDLTNIVGYLEALQEACDAAAFQFSDITKQTRNFDETYFVGGGPLNNDRESDGADKEMEMSANRLKRVKSIVAPNRRITMPEYESYVNYTYISYFGGEKKLEEEKFYVGNDTAREIMDNKHPYLPQFNLSSSCQLNSIMCCFTEDRLNGNLEDNTDVCAHDLETSHKSNHVRHGLGVYDSKVPAYCTAFKWDDDENSASYQYRGNALFDISFGTFLEKGYVKNIPGAPMCSCIEDMPTVTNAACRKVEVVNEKYSLKYHGSQITIEQENAEVTYSDCGENFKEYHYETAMEDKATEIDKHFVESCDDMQTEFLNDIFLIPGTTTQFDVPLTTEWVQVAGKGTSYYPTKTHNVTIRDEEFREHFEASPNGIVYRHCPLCRESHQDIYYRRLTDVPSSEDFNFINLFMNNWISANNTIHVDFDLFSTYEDAIALQNKWTHCNYDSENVGFPRDCGPTALLSCQWNSYTRRTCGPLEYRTDNHGFYIEVDSTSESSDITAGARFLRAADSSSMQAK